MVYLKAVYVLLDPNSRFLRLTRS